MEYKDCILTHIPVHECQLSRFKLNIHGHLHDKKIKRFILHKDLHVGYDVNYEAIYEDTEIESEDNRNIHIYLFIFTGGLGDCYTK